MTKLKAFADKKLNVDRKMISILDEVEKTVRKRENASYQHFLLLPQCYPKPSSLGSLKVRIVCERVKRPRKKKSCFRLPNRVC